MKVKLIKRSADNRVIVELEDEVKDKEFGQQALRRLEREANYFLSDRDDRIKMSRASKQSKAVMGGAAPVVPFKATTIDPAPPGATATRPFTTPSVTQPFPAARRVLPEEMPK